MMELVVIVVVVVVAAAVAVVVVVVVAAPVVVEEVRWVIGLAMNHHKIYTKQKLNLQDFDNFVAEIQQVVAAVVDIDIVEEEGEDVDRKEQYLQKKMHQHNHPSNQHSFVVDEEEHVVRKQPMLNQNHQEDL